MVVIGCDSGFMGLAVESNDCSREVCGDLEERREGVDVDVKVGSLFLLGGRA